MLARFVRLGARGGIGAMTGVLLVTSSASASVPHQVLPGETLWGIAAANNFTTQTVAAFNGLSEDAFVIAGETIQIPTEEEGAAALADAGITATEPTSTGSTDGTVEEPSSSAYATVTPSGAPLGHIPSPYGDLHLEAGAADAWNAMRAEAMSSYGIDIYPGGPLSAFRTYSEQEQLYELYLSGAGAPANPPGSSSHETGLAVDVDTEDMRWVIDQIGAAYGWAATVSNEWWHVEYVGG